MKHVRSLMIGGLILGLASCWLLAALAAAGVTPARVEETMRLSAQPGPTPFECPRNCAGARAMGLTAVQAAQCPRLDRDHDGVACYGD